MDLIAQVMTWPSILIALVGGFGVGFVLLSEVIQGDRFGTATANARTFGLVVPVILAFVVGVFYAGQIVSAIADHDPNWPRAAARYLVFLIFAIAAGAGTWAGLHREWRHR